MGIQIILQGKDFSTNNVGRIVTKLSAGDDADAAAYIQNVGMTSYSHKRATHLFFTELKTAGVWSKHDYLDLFYGTTVAQQSVRAKSLVSSMSFINDNVAAHTSKGYISDAVASRHLNLGYKAPVNTNNFWMGTSHSTPDTAASNSILFGGDLSYVFMARKGGATAAKVGAIQTDAIPAYPLTNFGLLIAARVSSTDLRLYDNGVQISSNLTGAATNSPSEVPLYLGSLAGVYIASTTFTYAGSGAYALTAQNVADLNTSLKKLNASWGR